MTTDKKQVKPIAHMIAGGISGTMSAIITCPLEVVKTRLQASSTSSNSIKSVMSSIYRADGVKGLWRGLGPNLVGIIPSRAIYFSSYASAKEYFTKLNGTETSSVHLVSAATAGVCVATATNPIWLIKTRMQLQGGAEENSERRPVTKQLKRATAAYSTIASTPPQYKNSVDCLVRVVREEGVKGLFRGLGASYLGVIEGTIHWITYEYLKGIVGTNKDLSSSDFFLTAAAAKFTSSVISYPHEVLRTRIRQVTSERTLINGNEVIISKPVYSGLGDVIKRVIRSEGILAFYGGMSAHLLRTVPNAAIMFLCYETFVRLIE